MFGHAHQPEGPAAFATSTLADGVHSYHSAVGAAQHAKRRMPLLRDMSYEDLPASDSYRLLPDVCDATGGGTSASEEDGAELRVRPAQYGGSFTVAGTDQATRSEYVRSTIHKLQVPTAGTKPVLLIVSLEGIKVCGPEGKEIYMSHALRRISYATCDPSRGQFSFLAREPRGHLNLQYCHTFFTGSADKAEELNTIVGNAFRMAYAARLQRSCLRNAGGNGDPSTWDLDGRNHHDKTNNRTWGRRSKHHREPSRRDIARGKNVNLTSTTSPVEAPEPTSTPASSRLAGEPRCPLLTGYVNEAVSTTDSESRSSESEGRPLSAGARSVSASSQSLREDAKSCQWSSASSSVSACHADGTSGGSTTPVTPPYYQQGPSQEAVELRAAAWFQAGIPREIALEVLSQEPVGAFMVRESTTKHGCYALSLRVPRDFQVSGIAHYLILKTAKGYKIKGFMKEFTSLTALITHHSVMPELLPCTLSLSRYNPNFARSESAQDLVELTDTDSEYNGLSELSRTTADTSV